MKLYSRRSSEPKNSAKIGFRKNNLTFGDTKDRWMEASTQKSSLIRLVIVIQYQLVIDEWTDRQSHDKSICHTSINIIVKTQ